MYWKKGGKRPAHRVCLFTMIAVFTASALACGGCGGGNQSRVVRMGFVQADIHDLAYYVAREKRFFQDLSLIHI